ncbi:hypothetical protein [Roseicella aerolata]|uniref:Uncharacterized protein n=1 Tax=Roseicella aerolata TaxID=2883479 RepID=A0A9X1IF37_9PROT|nr:hypothetical protein [Roseicella aerolata]MCB4823534.1 hypothetical protein [Roseicella aerolata]
MNFSSLLDLHLVAVVHNIDEPSRLHLGFPGLKTDNAVSADEQPFTVGCNFGSEFIHIIDGPSLFTTLTTLDTIKYFVSFLNDRRLTLAKRHCVIEGNENFLGAYLSSPIAAGKYSVAHQLTGSILDTVVFNSGFWTKYAQSPAWEHTNKENKRSYFIDRLIEHISEEYQLGRLVRSQEMEFSYHEQGWRFLARESRFSRRLLAGAFQSIFDEPDKTTFWSSSVSSKDYPDTRYVFLTYPQATSDKSYEKLENYISFHLMEYMFAAGAAFRDARYIVGVGIPNYHFGQHSIVLHIADTHSWGDREQVTAKKIRHRLGAFRALHANTTFHFE